MRRATTYTVTYTYRHAEPSVFHGELPGKAHPYSFGRILKDIHSRRIPTPENWSTLTISIDQSKRWGTT